MLLSESIQLNIANGAGTACVSYNGITRDWQWLSDVCKELQRHLTTSTNSVKRYGLIARNQPQHIAAFCNGLLTGCTTSIIHCAQSDAGIANDIETLKLPVVIADRSDWNEATLSAARLAGTKAIAISNEAQATDAVQVLIETNNSPQQPDKQTSSNHKDIAFELLSSGTTGLPKRIPLSWSTLETIVTDASAVYSGTGDKSSPQILSHPLGTIAGLAYVIPPLVYGQALVLLDKFDPISWAQAVDQYRPTRGSVPPVGIRMLLDANIPPEQLSSLQLIAVGGGSLDVALQEAFEEEYGIPVLTAFGATEFGGVIANWPLELYNKWGKSKRGSAGKASVNVQLRIVDPESYKPLPPGTTGLLEAKVARMGNDWIRSNDLARIDADGFLFPTGRADKAINRGGFKIVPQKVNNIIKQHPAIADAFVFGMADDRLGETPCAAVELVNNRQLSAGELQHWLKERLLAYEVPTHIKIMTALPRNTSLKISHADVKAMFNANT